MAQLVEHHLAKVRSRVRIPSSARSESRPVPMGSSVSWWSGREARQRTANPCTRVQIPSPPRAIGLVGALFHNLMTRGPTVICYGSANAVHLSCLRRHLRDARSQGVVSRRRWRAATLAAVARGPISGPYSSSASTRRQGSSGRSRSCSICSIVKGSAKIRPSAWRWATALSRS